MKILVTGSEGSLMQSVIPKLLSQGHEVIGIDSFKRYGVIDRDREYQFVQGDLCDFSFTKYHLKGVEAVFQAAATIYGVGGFHAFPADILSKDILLHQNILEGCLQNDVNKVIYISSSMVYERSDKIPSYEADTETMLVPLTDYGLSKLVGERLCIAFHNQYELNYCIWRPFNIITPYEQAEKMIGYSHVFADFMKRILVMKQNPLDIIGDGEQIRCFTWIEDVSSAISKYSLNSLCDGEVFNLGNPKPITMKQLANKIFKRGQENGILSKKDILKFNSVVSYKDDVRIRIPSINKAKTILNWSPIVDLDDSLKICFKEWGFDSDRI